MATKLKKWKLVASFAAFAVGVSLLMGSVCGAVRLLILDGGYNVRDVFAQDYQDTSAFRWQVSQRLEECLLMATGSPVGWNNTYAYRGDGTIISYSTYSGETWWSDRYATNEVAIAGTAGDTGERTDYTNMIADLHKMHQADKNVLYCVSYNGEEKFSNADRLPLSGKRKTLPDGYNFLLYFDGEKVTITKDGQTLDVYGDGYYDEGSDDWLLPGYTNFTVDEHTAKAEVTIAVAQEPKRYIRYGKDGASQNNSEMYWIKQNLERERQRYLYLLGGLAAGIALMALCHCWREEKRQADQAIARVVARLWHEALYGVWAIMFFGQLLRGEVLDAMGYVGYVLSGEVMYYAEEFGGMLYYMLASIGAFWLLSMFWLTYCIFLDLRYTPKAQRNCLFDSIRTSVRSASLKLPFQQRMVKAYRNLLLQLGGIVVMAGAICYFSLVLVRYYDGDRLIVPVIFCLFLLGVVALWTLLSFAKRNREAAEQIGAVVDQIAAVRNGDLTHRLPLPTDADLYEASRNLNDIQKGMQEALEEQTKSERMKVELITNVSHDIKTPLTSIISYAELLRDEEEGLPPHIQDYIRILNDKASRLKTMVQDVFEVSKAASGQLPVKLEPLDLGKLMRQTLADMAETIARSTVTIKTDIEAQPVMIIADGQRLYRVFQNLLQNALQYSLNGSRIYVTLHTEGKGAVAGVKNTSKVELAPDADFTERFVRGDQSRTDGGSGLGLSIARSFTESCGGQFRVETIADLFVVTVEFPIESH